MKLIAKTNIRYNKKSYRAGQPLEVPEREGERLIRLNAAEPYIRFEEKPEPPADPEAEGEQKKAEDSDQCIGITKAGAQCKNDAEPGFKTCPKHRDTEPEQAEEPIEGINPDLQPET